MDARDVAILVAEKMGLMATAGLASVLFLPLRNRLLGVQRPRDHLAVFFLGVALSMWGARLGVEWLGVAVDLRLTGVFIAGLLAGPKTGFITAMIASAVYYFRVAPDSGAGALLGTLFVGTTVGYLSAHRERMFEGKREIVTAAAILFIGTAFELVETELFGVGHTHLSTLPALAFEVGGNTASVFIFHSVTRVILSREEGAVALVEAKAASQAMSLLALRRRLEPHFLFNALNTVRATIRLDAERARDLVSSVADLYRYILHHPEDATVASEVEHACSYLEIENARLGETLDIELDIAPACAELPIPALLLQPVVENAVRHGVGLHEQGGVIRIEASIEDGGLELRVIDRGRGERVTSTHQGAGVALATLRESLRHRYGDAAVLTLDIGAESTIACIRLPVHGMLEADAYAS
jgi:LytS/YehU family sensor histidine kinase